jgi:hypothetical protein
MFDFNKKCHAEKDVWEISGFYGGDYEEWRLL